MLRCAPLFLALALPAFTQPAPPQFRLPDSVRPVRYRVELKIVPEQEDFSGSAEIDLQLREPASVIWLNAADLAIDSAQAGAATARVVAGGPDFAGFAFDKPLPAGPATLRLAWRGKLNGKSSAGLFRNKSGEEWYAFSQFEATDARRAFPCFDEPSIKVPWQLTLHVKREHMALANTPAVSETAEPGGMKAVKFAESKPLPSYLVAVAAGPFEAVEAGKVGPTPVRIITPRGATAQAKYAAEVTPQILATLENYFGIPYPYEKLDSIAVPLFFGAMENPGLVTYGLTLILSPADQDSVGRQRGYANTAAHELAHMWFGDLVTTAWWDDIWLNEAFATWMNTKVIEAWKPEWKPELSSVQSRLGAMNTDSLVSARRIRQPIQSKNDIANAFDGITYNKGAAVIHMFETWVGPEQFRKGVQIYMRRHAYSNATAADFLKAIGEAAGRDVAPAFSTFLDQAGVPLITGDLKCAAGQPPAVDLSQKRFLPLGSRGSAQQTWQVPVCLKFGDGRDTRRQCTLLAQPRAELRLSMPQGCPEWLLLNDGQNGYYRSLYRGDLLAKALAGGGRRLSAAERIGAIGDVQAAVRSGDLGAGEALKLVPEFANDPNRQIVSSTVGIVYSIRANLVPDSLRPNYVRFIRKFYGQRARELGWQPKPGEDDDTRLLRPTLLALVADTGEDPELLAQARQLARKWLQDRHAISPDMAGGILAVAAAHGDRSFYDALYAEAKKTKDEKERGQLLGALSAFRDPAIVQANFGLLLSGEFDFREATGLLFGPLGDPRTREMPFQFVKQNYDRILARLPAAVGTDYSAYLPFVASAFCDEAHRTDAEAFFKERSARSTGGPRILAQALESVSLCAANRQAQEPAVAEFLRQY